MRSRLRSLFVVGAAALALLAGGPFTQSSLAQTADDHAVIDKAIAWLLTQQQPDGSFEVAKFAGFETPEAVLAIAADAQTRSWTPREAITAVQAVTNNAGRNALDSLDDLADRTGGEAVSAGLAAKLIALVLQPLCLDPTRFDPQYDGATNLLERMQAGKKADGRFGAFSDTLYVAIALGAMQLPAPPETIAAIRAAQQDNGGFNFSGTPFDEGFDDIDTTALAIDALDAHVRRGDGAIAAAETFLRDRQAGDGSWNFGDPNSTALAALAFEEAADPSPSVAARTFLRSLQRPDGRIASANDSFGVNTYATTQTVRALFQHALPVSARPDCWGDEYHLFASDGGVFSFPAQEFEGSAAAAPLNSPIVAGATTPNRFAYVLFASDGGVFTFGGSRFFGSAVGRTTAAVVDGAILPNSLGHVLFGADGSVYELGADAPLAGTVPKLNSPTVGGALTPKGDGAILFAADGGVFTLGSARFFGSMGATKLNSPIVGGAITATGLGYVLFAADGGVFTFGDARFFGSMGATKLNSPIVGGAVTPTGAYVLFAADGGAFTFADARFLGSTGALTLNKPIVGGALA